DFEEGVAAAANEPLLVLALIRPELVLSGAEGATFSQREKDSRASALSLWERVAEGRVRASSRQSAPHHKFVPPVVVRISSSDAVRCPLRQWTERVTSLRAVFFRSTVT